MTTMSGVPLSVYALTATAMSTGMQMKMVGSSTIPTPGGPSLIFMAPEVGTGS